MAAIETNIDFGTWKWGVAVKITNNVKVALELETDRDLRILRGAWRNCLDYLEKAVSRKMDINDSAREDSEVRAMVGENIPCLGNT